jgi:hypothetical protein
LAGTENVFVFIQGRTVHEDETVHHDGTCWKRAKVLEMLGREGLASPGGGQACERIEFGGVVESTARLVVVPADDHLGKPADLLDHFVRVRPVPYEITQAKSLIVFSLGELETNLERLKIRMDVTEEKIPQGNLKRAAL